MSMNNSRKKLIFEHRVNAEKWPMLVNFHMKMSKGRKTDKNFTSKFFVGSILTPFFKRSKSWSRKVRNGETKKKFTKLFLIGHTVFNWSYCN